MKFKRALVTGGAGFIGSHLVERLLQEGLQVVVLDDLSVGKRENVPPEAEFVLGDVCDEHTVASALSGSEVAFHLAAKVSIRGSVEGFYEDAKTNVMGTLSLLQACIRERIQRFIYASSMAVYADASDFTQVSEDFATVPVSPYGVGKLACERYVMLIAAQSGFEAVALRYFNTYGPRQGFTPYVGVITIFIQRLLRGEPPMIFGDGEQRRDFVHVDDVVDATIRAMTRGVSGHAFNVGSGVGTTVNQIAKMLCNRLRPGTLPVHGPAHSGELRNSVADIRRARAVLRYEPKSRFDDRIDEIIAWNRGAA